MEDYLARYGITRYINAHDTITLYGGSRMPEQVKAARNQISDCFVDMVELQKILGDHIAQITHNEGAYIANCAAGALQLCAAVCMARGDAYAYKCLPETREVPNEFLVIHAQAHCYLKSLEAAGAKIVTVGDADEVLEYDLRAHITDKTAALIYSPALPFRRGSLPLEDVIRIAHDKGKPVIVDAAAQLPPKENLWLYTSQGADLVVFSGGKTLSGPQTSGLILGRRSLIEDCRRFGAPQHGICRSSKASREDMIGLAVALDLFME